MQDPQSLHKYLYVHGDPVNGIDPKGESLIAALGSLAIVGAMRGLKLGAVGAVSGAIIGGIDASLAGQNIVKGAINGAKWGGAIGFSLGFLAPFATTFLAPATISQIADMGAGASLFFGAAGFVDSFQQGHVAQGFFRLGLGFFGAYSLRRAAMHPTKPVNIGGEGEVPGALNLQGRWALGRTYGRAQPTRKGEPAGQNLAGMIAEGHEFVIYNARTGKLPFADSSVPKVYTNTIPIDTPPGGAFGGAPGVTSSEISRVLRPGGRWIKDGVVFFTKPG